MGIKGYISHNEKKKRKEKGICHLCPQTLPMTKVLTTADEALYAPPFPHVSLTSSLLFPPLSYLTPTYWPLSRSFLRAFALTIPSALTLYPPDIHLVCCLPSSIYFFLYSIDLLFFL